MARLPSPGGDVGDWGGILNDFLNQAHNADGSLKNVAAGIVSFDTTNTSGNGVTNTTVQGATEQVVSNLVTGLANKIDTANLDNDSALAANSTTRLPSQQAVKSFVNNTVSVGPGLIANRPAVALPGQMYNATDTSELWQWNGSAWALANRPEVHHAWAQSNTAGWSPIKISGTGVHATNSLSVVSGRGRFASSGTDTDGNYRECWVRDGTYWQDSEIRSVWYPPSALDSAIVTPQMGHLHRAGPSGAVVVDQNIVSNVFETTFLADWGWSAGNLTIGLNTTLVGGTARYPFIKAVQRLAGTPGTNVLYVDHLKGLAIGDVVTINGCTDTTYNGTFTITGTSVDPINSFGLNASYVLVSDATHTTASARTVDMGNITYATPGGAGSIVPKQIYPMNVVSRVIGTTIYLKKWRIEDPEPNWNDPYQTKTLDISGESSVGPWTIGKCGVMVNHLHGAGAYVEYGDVQMKKL